MASIWHTIQMPLSENKINDELTTYLQVTYQNFMLYSIPLFGNNSTHIYFRQVPSCTKIFSRNFLLGAYYLRTNLFCLHEAE